MFEFDISSYFYQVIKCHAYVTREIDMRVRIGGKGIMRGFSFLTTGWSRKRKKEKK